MWSIRSTKQRKQLGVIHPPSTIWSPIDEEEEPDEEELDEELEDDEDDEDDEDEEEEELLEELELEPEIEGGGMEGFEE